MSIEDDEILQGFIEESLEHLADIENDLLAIEEGGADIDVDLVNKVFRAAHSIKGGAGFMGLTVIQNLAHAAENVLGLIRSEKLVPTPDIINVLLMASDELQQLIENVETSNEVDITEHVNALNAIYETGQAPAADSGDKAEQKPEEPAEEAAAEAVEEQSKNEAEAAPQAESVPQDTVTEADVAQEQASAPEPEPEPEQVQAPPPEPAPAPSPAPATQAQKEKKPAKKSKAAHKADTTIRVTVSLLDQLMNLAGELVLSRNQLLQTITSGDVRNAETVGQRIDLVTSELQEAIMLTRMQPIGNVFNKFPRVGRDLSKKLNKQMDLTIVGKDVELDKTIIEAINDPLTHLVRNSVDHGIEPPDERIRKGKNPKGLIVLKAYHEAGQVVIEISDDGKGLDGNMLAETAINKGLITQEQAKTMSEKERVNLILLPGFSTAKKVTDVSGRGVGMDVVKTNLDQLGGSIEIESEVGKGTTISVKLPLTLAIIPCQIVMTGGERYAIPQVNLEELLRIPASRVKERIERVGDAEVVRLRGNLLPLIRLSDVLDIPRTYYDPTSDETRPDRRENVADRRSRASALFNNQENAENEKPESVTLDRKGTDRRQSPASALNIVVVSTGAMKYGLIVDRLHDSEEIVIKPLGRHLQQCKGYAGATIMGDGRIALILDVSNLSQMAGLTSLDGTERASELADAAKDAIIKAKDKQALLTFSSSPEEQFAVPLNQVERVEKIKRSDIEDVGGRRVMQYRGGSLPLISIDEVAMVQPLSDQNDLLVIVFNLAGKDIGLLAIGPIDAIEVAANVDDMTLKQTGIMGSSIIDGHTTMLVDIFDMVQTINPDWFADHPMSETVVSPDSDFIPTILIVEDSNFFRNQVRNYMEEAGFNVLEAEDGVEALEVLEGNVDDITMVVTDIEMPNMDGFELTEKIRQEPRFAQLPVIALTTLAGDEDVAKGKAVGIDEYHIKLDKERLMECVHRYVKEAEPA
jgi:two-component system chemotaxis sensor kinase CheA